VAHSKKFKLEGGRAGSITFVEGGASGHLDWEMLTGDVYMAIYPGSCSWLTPRETRMHPDDVRRLAQELAIEGNFAIEIALAVPRDRAWSRPSATATAIVSACTSSPTNRVFFPIDRLLSPCGTALLVSQLGA
jgi:hypothetical protein